MEATLITSAHQLIGNVFVFNLNQKKLNQWLYTSVICGSSILNVRNKQCKSYLITICGALHNLVPFVQFKKREKQPWKSVTFNTHQRVIFTFFTLYKWHQIAQSITYDNVSFIF